MLVRVFVLFWMALVSMASRAGTAPADCSATATVADAREAYERGLRQEDAGYPLAALGSYVAAQARTCRANPVAANAARRAAALARALGNAAIRRGDYATAFMLYERGGHYAAADLALRAWLATEPAFATRQARMAPRRGDPGV